MFGFQKIVFRGTLGLSIALASLASTSFANTRDLDCKRVKIRVRLDDKFVHETAEACMSSDYTVLVSKNFIRKSINKEKVVPRFTDTSPGFALCEKLGGRPEFVEFLAQRKWYELDRCVFKDQSFIDLGSLYQMVYGRN